MLRDSEKGLPSRREHVNTLRRKKGEARIEHLRTLAHDDRVCYEIWPIWSVSRGVRERVGFELMLCGIKGHEIAEANASHAVPYCQHCASTYDDLREITEWIISLKKLPFAYEIYAFDHALHLAPPTRQHRSELVLTTALFFQTHPKPAAHNCDNECLREVRERLAKLSIQEDVWLTAASATA